MGLSYQQHHPRHRPGASRPPDLPSVGVVEDFELAFPRLSGDKEFGALGFHGHHGSALVARDTFTPGNPLTGSQLPRGLS